MWRYNLTRRAISRCFSTSSIVRTRCELWDHVVPAPKDPITGVTEAFRADTSPIKINIGVGAYRDDEGKPVVLQCVREAEAKIAGSHFLESISSAVSSKLIEESVKLVYGKDSDILKDMRFAGIQALSGTGACRLFAEFQRRFHPKSQMYFPDPTWSNHHNIWRDAQIPGKIFRYYDPESKGLNFGALMDDVKKKRLRFQWPELLITSDLFVVHHNLQAPDGSFFLLHPCAHNPTGVDPTEEQWREISYQFKVKKHFPFFDIAYQGFASGDLDQDAKSIRIFLEDGHLMGCAQSYAKNMGLYGHRVGCLSVVCNDPKQAAAIKSQLQQIARAMYGSPPLHGILLVSTILADPNMKKLWINEVKDMADRIKQKRASLRERLEQSDSPLNWEHITNQVGMFCFFGLTAEQLERLARDFHVYMTINGRMSMAGVTTGNVDYLANAIHNVTKFDEEAKFMQMSSSA